ncbi:MAG: hypothetical protein J6D54_13805 [Olsenella sp.]|nr:hypothetical protein [Olsenella sp.]
MSGFLGLIFICVIAYYAFKMMMGVGEKNRAEKEMQEQERLKAEREEQQRFNAWKANVDKTLDAIIEKCGKNNLQEAKKQYSMLCSLGEQGRQKDASLMTDRYGRYYEAAVAAIESRLKHLMKDKVAGSLDKGCYGDYYGLPSIKVALQMLLHTMQPGSSMYSQRENIEKAIEQITTGIEATLKTTTVINLDEYGIPEFSSPNPLEMSDEEASQLLDSLVSRENQARRIAEDCCAGASILNESFISDSTRLMWYYAAKTPFDVHAFDNARRLHNAFTQSNYAKETNGFRSFGNTEELLARLYANNKVGGQSIVKLEEPYAMAWIDKNAIDCTKYTAFDFNSPFYLRYANWCFTLSSGLAWLELYDLEKSLLSTLMARKVQLPAELQERLSFLQSGHTKNIRLFEVADGSSFAYDSSSADWKSEEFAVFFRKLAMKKMQMNYSLALDNWTKSIPLRSGQQVSKDEIHEELQRMVRDFDGEVTCEKVDAYAVDLENVRYEDATLFRFTSERSRCVTVLFFCEKYGRNLNVTVMTLFTPESGMDSNMLERYAIAAKNNTYMESFRESILQALDDVLKVEKSIYGDDESAASNGARNIID